MAQHHLQIAQQLRLPLPQTPRVSANTKPLGLKLNSSDTQMYEPVIISG